MVEKLPKDFKKYMDDILKAKKKKYPKSKVKLIYSDENVLMIEIDYDDSEKPTVIP